MKPMFNKAEIRAVLSKASEIQSQRELFGDQDKLTQEELIQVAEAAGIDRTSVLEALQNMDKPTFNHSYNWLEGTSRLQEVAVVNEMMTDDQWEDVVREIRRVTGGIGKISKEGSSYEWEQRRSEIGYKHISVTPKQGKTEIQLVNSWNGVRFVSGFVIYFALFFILAIGLKGNIPKSVGILTAFFGSGIIGFPIHRLFLNSYFKRQKDQLDTLVSGITKRIKALSQGSRDIVIPEKEGLNEEYSNSVSQKTRIPQN
ncbi:MAG: hypothetical protein AAFW89_05715 [Bacteroidota bacterium]